jgi:N-acetylmuramic acid 6-phosphate etherase
MISTLQQGTGRLIYAGAGCSIRIGVQDGVELVPTFGWSLSRLAYLIAGGPQALSVSVEGAEDDRADAIAQVSDLSIQAGDVVIGVAASGNTPFTCAALSEAQARGALTIAVSSNPRLISNLQNVIC